MKQIIVMRTDLGMRKGKMIAQGAHASMGAILPYMSNWTGKDAISEHLRQRDKVDEWLANSFTKVCVRVNSLDELMDVYDAAERAGLIACLITDNGLTEFHGVPTVTCCAIGPDTDEVLHPITGELKLL